MSVRRIRTRQHSKSLPLPYRCDDATYGRDVGHDSSHLPRSVSFNKLGFKPTRISVATFHRQIVPEIGFIHRMKLKETQASGTLIPCIIGGHEAHVDLDEFTIERRV